MSHCKMCDAACSGPYCADCAGETMAVGNEITRLRAEVERMKAENAKLEADAKLGRMVRGMPRLSSIGHNNKKWIYQSEGPNVWADGPLEALERAGVRE